MSARPARLAAALAVLTALMGAPAQAVPADAEALLARGREAAAAGATAQAVDLLRESLAATPDRVGPLVDVGIALADLGAYEPAKTAFERALRLGPEDAAALNGLGYVHYRQDRIEPAIGCYRKALARKEDPQFHLNLGLAYLAQERWGQAEDEFRVAVKGQPEDFWSHNNLGYALQLQGKLEAAMDAYETAIALSKTDVTAHGNLGSLLAGARAWPEAALIYRDALKRDDACAEAHTGLANAYTQLNRLDEAILELRVAMRLKPADAPAHHLMAELYRHKQELAAARREAEAAIKLDPGAPAYVLTLGQILVSLNRNDEATRAFERYLRLSPQGEEAVKVRRWLEGRKKRK